MEYQRANKLKAVFLFLFAWGKYHALALHHGMAVALEADDLRKAFQNGTFPSEEQKRHAEQNTRKFTKHLRLKLFYSLCWIALAGIAAVGIASYGFGPNVFSALTCAKVLTFGGTFLGAWATLFELGGGIATMSGEALHEIIHPVIFQVLFIPGVLLIFVGGLI